MLNFDGQIYKQFITSLSVKTSSSYRYREVKHINIMIVNIKKIIFTFLTGILIITSSYGQVDESLNLVDGKGLKQGKWEKTDTHGRILYQGQFVDDIPFGTFTYYDSVGKVKAITEFFNKGSRAYTKIFDKGFIVSEGEYIKEQKNGLWKFYNQDSIVIAEENYINGIPHGTWKIYYHDGNLLDEVQYVNGTKEGNWIQYFSDGAVKTKATYKKGKLEGLATFYHPNGRVFISGPYINNLKDGIWMHLDDKGVTEKREVWTGGFLKSEEYYNKATERMVKEEK